MTGSLTKRLTPSRRLRDEQQWLTTFGVVIIAFVAISVGLAYTAVVMIPFVLSIFLANIVAPIMDVQVLRMKLPRSLAVGTTLIVTVGMVVAAGAALTLALVNARYQTQELIFGTIHQLTQMEGWIEELGVTEEFKQVRNEITSKLPGIVSQSLGTGLNVIVGSILTLIFTAFLLAGRDSKRLRTGLYAEIDSKIRRFISTKFMISLLTGVLVYTILELSNLPLASLFGILVFLLNFIPSIGSIIATLLPIPIAIGHFGDNWWGLAAVILIPGAIQMTIGNVVEPKVMGDGLQLHPASILLALAFWGLLWGPIGMLLAAPITATIRIVLSRFETTLPIAELLAGRLPSEPDPPPSDPETGALLATETQGSVVPETSPSPAPTPSSGG